MKSHSLSFRIAHKEIAYAIFQGQHLLFWEVHSIVADPNRRSKYAGNAAFRFDRFNITAAILENKWTSETGSIHAGLKEVMQARGVPIFEINKQEVLDSFNLSSPKDLQELCRAAAPLFPQIQFARFMYPCLEAAAIGLYFETNRILSINKPLE